jgi:limonene-1,2-epoxide hydrolase
VSDFTQARVRRLLDLVAGGGPGGKEDAIGALFAADACYHVQVPLKEKVHGPKAIVAELLRQTAHYADLEIELVTIVSDERFVVTERVDHLTLPQGGKRVANALVAIFEVNDRGLIAAWREYWDMVALGRAMGLPLEALAAPVTSG